MRCHVVRPGIGRHDAACTCPGASSRTGYAGHRLRVMDAIECVPDLYERKPVDLMDSNTVGVETYIFRQSVDGMPDCGCRWEHQEIE